jgi:Zn-dependent protease
MLMPLNVVVIFFEIVVLILAFSVHECAHAWAAMRLGDPTAMMMGRVTLNPLKHLDPVGSVLFPLISLVYGGFLVGWAKPTPVTGRNFKNYKRDDILVTLAGPASNLLSATIALILLIVLKHLLPAGDASIATAVAIAEHIPGVATEGLPALFPIALFLYFVIFINLLLFVFNLIPLPPLDGSHVLRHFLPYKAAQLYDRMGMFALLILFFVGGRFISALFYPLYNIFNHILFSV